MTDLFSTADPDTGEEIALADAEVTMRPHFLPRSAADRFFDTFMREIAWEQRKVFVWGKWHEQPRLVAWYGDPHAVYSYSGTSMTPVAWTATLIELRQLVEAVARVRFNSVLLNLYRNEQDRMGWHSDDEPELGPQPVIASVSLGETREVLFKRRGKHARASQKVAMTHGSLMIMAGDTQKNWLHSVGRKGARCGPRINLTFREIRPAAL